MIELPEANVLAAQISRALSGRCIDRVEANRSPHKFAWYTGDPAEYPARLAGKTITGAQAVGGHVEVSVNNLSLILSVRLRLLTPAEKRPDKHQLLLDLDDGSALMGTVQMWGLLLCQYPQVPISIPDYEIARQRPSPLSPEFTRAYFDNMLAGAAASLSAKAFLATEQRIPGLGNGVLQDILWNARIHPRRKMSTLNSTELEGLFRSVVETLRTMTDQGGRDTEPDLFGQPGGYQTILASAALSRPCPSCGGPIRKEAYLGGSVYYCAECQRQGEEVNG